MELSDKVGIAIAAVGGIIDAFEIFWPGAISRMSHQRRIWVFVIGTTMMAVGLGVVFLWPTKHAVDPPIQAATQAGAQATGLGAVGPNRGIVNNNFGAPPTQPPPPASAGLRTALAGHHRHNFSTSSASGACAPGANCTHQQADGLSIGTQNNYATPP